MSPVKNVCSTVARNLSEMFQGGLVDEDVTREMAQYFDLTYEEMFCQTQKVRCMIHSMRLKLYFCETDSASIDCLLCS